MAFAPRPEGCRGQGRPRGYAPEYRVPAGQGQAGHLFVTGTVTPCAMPMLRTRTRGAEPGQGRQADRGRGPARAARDKAQIRASSWKVWVCRPHGVLMAR